MTSLYRLVFLIYNILICIKWNLNIYYIYSHSNPPLVHSYVKPIPKIKKKKRVINKPKIEILFKEIDQGKRRTISKSKTKNKIAIIKNLIENGFPGW